MKLRFTLRAAENLADIADYIHARNPSTARRVRAVIYETLQNLILFPHVGRSQQVEGPPIATAPGMRAKHEPIVAGIETNRRR
jgi:plasmid stabilization system protein ParE